MDGVTIRLDANASFEFRRNSGSPAAVASGDVETGAFVYTPTGNFNVIRAYDNLNGDRSNFRYPQSVVGATYSYRAINENSGVLTLTATGSFGTIYFGFDTALNASWIRLFYTHSPQSITNLTNIAEMAITFTSNGQSVASDIVTLRLPESPLVGTLDTVRIPTTLTLTAGGLVPENYNPTVDPLRPSAIAPSSLENKFLSATHGGLDPTKNFSLQFAPDATQIQGAPNTTLPDEVGKGILSVYDPALVPPGLRAVSVALDYTWTRIGGTDSGRLVLSNIPDDPAFPFDNSLNGTLLLDFSGTDTGTYTGQVDGDTPDAADVTGKFLLPD